MSVRYAGVDLSMDDPGGVLQRWLDDHLTLEDLVALGSSTVYQAVHKPVGFPLPNYERVRRVKLNSLYWPTGASRWSVGHFLASTSQKNQIVSNLDWGETSATTLSWLNVERSGWLEFGEPGYGSPRVMVKMFLLPPRPITVRMLSEPEYRAPTAPGDDDASGRAPGDWDKWNPRRPRWVDPGGDTTPPPTPPPPDDPNVVGDGLWIMPIVDVRYYWQFFSVGEDWRPPSSGAQNWTDAIRRIADKLSVIIGHTDIETAYGEVDTQFAKGTEFHNAAYILDGLAWCLDRRLVHQWRDMGMEESTRPSGTSTPQSQWVSREFELLTHDQSRDREQENLTRQSTIIGQPSAHRGVATFRGAMVAGDDFSSSHRDYPGAVVPQHLRIVFRRCNGGLMTDPPDHFVKTYNAVDFTSVNMNEPPYVYWGTEKIIRTQAIASFPSTADGTPSNATDVNALGQQLADQYFESLLIKHDYKFASVQFWSETGYDDHVEYNFGHRRRHGGQYEAETRVAGPTYNFGVEEMFHWLGECSVDSSRPDGGHVDNCCGLCGSDGGSITECEVCNLNGAPNSWAFMFESRNQKEANAETCCQQLKWPQVLLHDSGCVWSGPALDQCAFDTTEPNWELNIGGLDPYDVSLSITLEDTKSIVYKNPYPFCCNCQNELRLVCPDALPTDCIDIPCWICLSPGAACCPIQIDRMTATFTEQDNCPCADGLVMTLIWDSVNNWWRGQGTFCTHGIQLTIRCGFSETTAGTGDCNDYRLDVEWLDNCGSNATYAPTTSPACSCDPFSLTFETVEAGGTCCNATDSPSGSVTIVLTS